MSEARVRVSFDDRVIEVEGTESFVISQLEKYDVSIRSGLARKAGVGAPPQTAADDGLDRIFRLSDGIVHIVPDVPGRNRRDRMANVARLLACGVDRLQNRPMVTFREVNVACRAQRCYDPANLGMALKNRKASFVFGGRRRYQTIALTELGKREAERLIRAFVAPSLA